MASILPRLTTHLAIAGGTSSFLLQRQTIHAEDKDAELAPAATSRRATMAIYDKVPVPPTLLPAHMPLQDEVAQARRWLQTSYAQLHAQVRKGARTWIKWEGKGEAQMKSMIAPDETLVPGGLYITIATLTGSILARNRSLMLRLALPGMLFGGGLAYFLPKTAAEISAQLQVVQQRRAPALSHPLLTIMGKGQSHS
ncbi:BZ3501_MvSof-1269-A2-R1_Chr12-3g03612 [Microbotryum saponariae]|nr:BZ3501_MvSof-1269-A2-R1_Chr12-3g03612 [Microbotryum saponariae]